MMEPVFDLLWIVVRVVKVGCKIVSDRYPSVREAIMTK